MAWLFSKRCKKALAEKKIKVSIPNQVRVRLWKLIEKYDETDKWERWESPLFRLPDIIKSEIGCMKLLAYPKDKMNSPAEESDLEGFVLRGNYPPYVFDTLEIFYQENNDEIRNLFQQDFNQIMEESDLPWRMANGKIFLVDSTYIEEEILRRPSILLKEIEFAGALQEFEKSRVDLCNGDYEGAIQNANLAVESTIKGIINVPKAKPGVLFRKLIDSGIIPEYYEGFLKAFEENILRSVAIIRNEELGVGHGQGINTNEIPKSLAEFAVNLAGVLIKYLIDQHLVSSLKHSNEDIR